MYAKIISKDHFYAANAVIIWNVHAIGRYLLKDGSLAEGQPHGSEIKKPHSQREAIGLLKKFYRCPMPPMNVGGGDIEFRAIERKETP